MGSSGKSGALFYYTKDRKYMLKSISGREFAQLVGKKVLESFLVHFDANPESLLIRFFGAYKLRWKDPSVKKCGLHTPETTSYIVVMNNVFEHFDIGLRFDMKGSQKSRTVLMENQSLDDYLQTKDASKSLKCVDFTSKVGTLTFKESMMPRRERNDNLITILKNDSRMLMQNDLMDYSLILGKIKQSAEQVRKVCRANPLKGRGVYIDQDDQPWMIGVIDPLNPYDIEKKAEYYLKVWKHGETMSCIPPHPYKLRWDNFMENCFKEPLDHKERERRSNFN